MSNQEIPIYKPPSKITFHPDGKTWAIEITLDGIKFNRDLFPNSDPEDFAKCFMDLLEMNYDVKFIKRDRSSIPHVDFFTIQPNV